MEKVPRKRRRQPAVIQRPCCVNPTSQICGWRPLKLYARNAPELLSASNQEPCLIG